MIINAISCSFKDVQDAFDQALLGDKVVIPSGQATWKGEPQSSIGVDLILNTAVTHIIYDYEKS